MKKLIGLILIVAGALKLVELIGWIDFTNLWHQPWVPYVLAIAVIAIGSSLIDSDKDKENWQPAPVPQPAEKGKPVNIEVRFSSQEIIYRGEPFSGASINARFGGVRLDLRGAAFEPDTTIEINSRFAGVDLLVPFDVQVDVEGKSVFGGVDKRSTTVPGQEHKHLRIVANNKFGGINIKN